MPGGPREGDTEKAGGTEPAPAHQWAGGREGSAGDPQQAGCCIPNQELLGNVFLNWLIYCYVPNSVFLHQK